MAVTPKPLIPAKDAEAAQTTQYVASNGTAIIDKFTGTNHDTVSRKLTVNLVTAAGAAGPANIATKDKQLAAGETYTFPEIVGHILGPGDFISTIADAAAAISIRASGREVTG